MNDASPSTNEPTAATPWQLEKRHRHLLPSGVMGIALSQSSDGLLAACLDGVYHVERSSGEVSRLYTHASYAASVVSLPGTSTILSAGWDGALCWFDLDRRSLYRTVQAHRFWSWDMDLSRDGRQVATVTGQYLAGGLRYEPAPEREPSVKIFDALTGDLRHAFSHQPPVQSVAFSHDGKHVAAGNLMGEVRVWNVDEGRRVASFRTDAFTSWGIIKSHCYIGGIYAIAFSPDNQALYLAGMGPMRDPMAGNGRQLWQKYDWQTLPAKQIDQTHDGQSGEGLMETLALHPSGQVFLMGGRLRGGKWNAALFDVNTGDQRATLGTGYRMTDALFADDGQHLWTAGARKQGNPREKKTRPFGVVELYNIT